MQAASATNRTAHPARGGSQKRAPAQQQPAAVRPSGEQNGNPSQEKKQKKQGVIWTNSLSYGQQQYAELPRERSLFTVFSKGKETHSRQPSNAVPIAVDSDDRFGTPNLPGRKSSLPRGFNPFPRSAPKKTLRQQQLVPVAEAALGLDGSTLAATVAAHSRLPSITTSTPGSMGTIKAQFDPTATAFVSPLLGIVTERRDVNKLSVDVDAANQMSPSRDAPFQTAKSHQTRYSSSEMADTAPDSPEQAIPRKAILTPSASTRTTSSTTDSVPKPRSRDSSFASYKLPGGRRHEVSRDPSYQTAQTHSRGTSAASSNGKSSAAAVALPHSREASASSAGTRGSNKSVRSNKSSAAGAGSRAASTTASGNESDVKRASSGRPKVTKKPAAKKAPGNKKAKPATPEPTLSHASSSAGGEVERTERVPTPDGDKAPAEKSTMPHASPKKKGKQPQQQQRKKTASVVAGPTRGGSPHKRRSPSPETSDMAGARQNTGRSPSHKGKEPKGRKNSKDGKGSSTFAAAAAADSAPAFTMAEFPQLPGTQAK